MEQLGDFVKASWVGKTLIIDDVKISFTEKGMLLLVGETERGYVYENEAEVVEERV